MVAPNFTLPPATRAAGTPDPANDMDNVIKALQASGAVGNVMSSAYGTADPTGVSDSTAAINAALAAVPASGGLVYMPAGTYLVNAATALAMTVAGTSLRGDGPGATTIVIGGSFSAAQVIAITASNCKVSDLSIVGASSTITANPACDGIVITGAVNCRVSDIWFQYVNGWCVRSIASATVANTPTFLSRLAGWQCAGGVHCKSNNGTLNAAGSFTSQQFLTDMEFQIIGAGTGPSANLDVIRLEDAADVLLQGYNASLSDASTGAPLRIIGACSSSYFSNVDIGIYPLASSETCDVLVIADNGNSPGDLHFVNCEFAGGRYGLNANSAGNGWQFVSCRFYNNFRHGAEMTGSGPGWKFVSCIFTNNNQGNNANTYDLESFKNVPWYMQDCAVATTVGSGAGKVAHPIRDFSGVLQITNCQFTGGAAGAANIITANGAVVSPALGRGNAGMNPIGSVTPAAIGASPATITIPQFDTLIIFTAINGMTAFAIAGVTVASPPQAGVPWRVPAGQTVTVTWATTAPTWIWIAE